MSLLDGYKDTNNTNSNSLLDGYVDKDYHTPQLGDQPNYDDILNNKSLNPQQQAEQIKQRGETYRSNLDRDLNFYKAKKYTGAALEIGSAAIPFGGAMGAGAKVGLKVLKPVAGKAIATAAGEGLGAGLASGAMFGVGRGLTEDKNPLLTGLQDAGSGALFGGALGFGGAKISQKLLSNRLNNYDAFDALNSNGRKALRQDARKYYQNYIQGTKTKRADLGNIDFTKAGLDETLAKNLNASKDFSNLKNNIKKAEYEGTTPLYKERKDDITQFHTLSDENNQYFIAQDDKGNKYYLTKEKDGSTRLHPYEDGQIKPSNDIITNSEENFNPNTAKLPKENIHETTYKEIKTPQGAKFEAGLIADDIPENFNPAQSKFAQTVKNSALATDDLKNAIGDVGYNQITNADTLANAQKEIDLDQNAAIAKIFNTEMLNAHEVAMAMDLARRLQNSGDIAKIDVGSRILEDLSRKAAKTGQASQALAMWQAMTPEGALLSYQRAINNNVPEHIKPVLDSVKTIEKQLKSAQTPQEVDNILKQNLRSLNPNAKTRISRQIKSAVENGTLDTDVLTNAIKSHFGIKTVSKADIDEINALTSQIASAKTPRDKEVATALLRRKISEVKPTSFARKLSTTQAMAQLLNPKTTIRNILGNSLYGGTENLTQSLVATPIDKVVSKFTGERSIVPTNPLTQLKGMREGFKQGAQDVRLGIDTATNKYDLPSGRTFRSGLGEKAEKLMNYTLRVPDRAAYQAVFDESVQNQMRALNLKAPTQDILDRANQEASERTFQDDSRLSQIFQGGKQLLNKVGTKEFGLGDLVLKYAKTPANILSRGMSYSPLGLAKGTGELLAPNFVKTMPFNQRKAVMDISRGLVGTGVMGGGVVLANQNAVTGEREKNAKLNANEMAMGQSPYSVKIGDKNYSYDWAVPLSMPLSAGVDYNNAENFIGSLAASANTIIDQPLLQGVQKISGGGYKTIPEGLMDTAIEAPLSFYPSFLRQTAQTVDPIYRETRDTNPLRQVGNRALSNVPFASKLLPAKYDVTGQPVKRAGGAMQAFLNPANVRDIKNDKVLNNAMSLYQSQDNARALMPIATKKVKLGAKKQISLNNNQLSTYQKDLGNIGYKLRDRALSNPVFNTPDDSEKVKYFDNLNQSINQAVKIKLFGFEPQKYERYTKEILNNYEDFTKEQ